MAELVATISFSETVKCLKVARKTLLDLLCDGTIFGYKNSMGQWRISVDSIKQYQELLRKQTVSRGSKIVPVQSSIQLNGRDPNFIQNAQQFVAMVQNSFTELKSEHKELLMNMCLIFGELVNTITIQQCEVLDGIEQIKQIRFNSPPPAIIEVDESMIDEVKLWTKNDEKKATKIIRTAHQTNATESITKRLMLRDELKEHPLFERYKDL
jgi:hypothetical protein